MATIVHIHLSVIDSSPTEWFHALSIPRTDIERLTHSPIKWLRFATFSFCGAKGHFSTTRGGEILVDENSVSFDDLAERYYYITTDDYHLVDHLTFDGECTSSVATPRRTRFRDEIIRRDRRCVFSEREPDACDAVHIIPRSKGDEYITFIAHDRSSLYEQPPFSPEGIDCMENGMLLRPEIHKNFGLGEVAFLKTPNFAMAPADVPFFSGDGDIAHKPGRTTVTLQYLKRPTDLFPFPPRDVQADWFSDGVRSPPSILLDFMYGAAVVNRWQSDSLRDRLKERFKDKVLNAAAEGGVEPHDSQGDSDCLPLTSHRDGSGLGLGTFTPEGDEDDRVSWKGKQKRFSSDASAGLLQAMDDVLRLSRLLKGNKPRSMAAESEKLRKEKELRSQQRGAEKVRQWLDSDVSTPL